MRSRTMTITIMCRGWQALSRSVRCVTIASTSDLQRVIAHFMQVNQCSYEQYEAHSRAAWERQTMIARHEMAATTHYSFRQICKKGRTNMALILYPDGTSKEVHPAN